MKQTQEQIEHLRTIQETSSFWADVAENQLPALADKIDNIDLTPIENKVDEGVSTLSAKIDNIDLSSVAKQGENPEATMSKVYDAVKSIPDMSLLYAARAEKNDDGENTYTIVLPVTAKAVLDDNGVATIQL
jgi:hypothetical protein